MDDFTAFVDNYMKVNNHTWKLEDMVQKIMSEARKKAQKGTAAMSEEEVEKIIDECNGKPMEKKAPRVQAKVQKVETPKTEIKKEEKTPEEVRKEVKEEIRERYKPKVKGVDEGQLSIFDL